MKKIEIILDLEGIFRFSDYCIFCYAKSTKACVLFVFVYSFCPTLRCHRFRLGIIQYYISKWAILWAARAHSTLVAAKQNAPHTQATQILNLKMRYIFKLNFVSVCSKQQNGIPNIPFAYPYRWGCCAAALLIQTTRYTLPWVARVLFVALVTIATVIESHMCRLCIDVSADKMENLIKISPSSPSGPMVQQQRYCDDAQWIAKFDFRFFDFYTY